jgi:hypothetical protein
MGERRRGLTALGAVILVAMLVAAAGLWYASLRRIDGNVSGFARAPEGCATTLDFERVGEFVLYVETTGRLDAVRGDCDAPVAYSDAEVEVARVEFSLRGADGSQVQTERDGTGDGYDTGGFAGQSWGVVEIQQPGRHVLTVGPNDGAAFALAIGGDPREGVALLRWLAVAAAVSGLLVGGFLMLLGNRRTAVDEEPASPWQPQAPGWPTAPPGFPTPPPTTGATGPAGSGGASTAPGPPTAHGSPWGPPRSDQ